MLLDDNEKDEILSAFKEWERHTCLTFRPVTDTDKHSVLIQDGVGCNSFVGRDVREGTGVQTVVLQRGACRTVREALKLIHPNYTTPRAWERQCVMC